MERWTAQRGGVVEGPLPARLSAACDPLLHAVHSPVIELRVLDADAVGAYAWAGGRVYVTRGLLALLDDDELAAAVAHEVGHLLDAGHLRAVHALDGCARHSDRETRADMLGTQLLEAAAYPRQAMVNMLQKVQAAQHADSQCHQALSKRIDTLQTLSLP